MSAQAAMLGAASGRAGGVKAYDFKRPDRFSRDQLRSIARISETFARAAATSLSSDLGLPCDLTLELVDQMTYGEFIDPLSPPGFLGIASMRPLGDGAVLRLDPAACDLLAERLFGSPEPRLGSGLAKAGAVEAAVLGRQVGKLLSALGTAWDAISPVAPVLEAAETDARFCQVVPPYEMIVLCRFKLAAAGASGIVDAVYPFLLLEPAIKKLSLGGRGGIGGGRWGEASRVGDAARRLEVEADIAVKAGPLSVDDLRRLRRGSTIALPGLDEGRAVLRLGGTVAAGLVGLRVEAGRVVASFEGAGARQEPEDAVERLSAATREGLESIRRTVEGALSALAGRVDGLEGGQEALADRVSFGLSDADRPGGHPLSAVAAARPQAAAALLAAERPQLRALVLSRLDDASAANVLASLPPEAQAEAVRRVASIDRVAPEVVALVGRTLGASLAKDDSAAKAGGVDKAVGMLNLAPREIERRVIGELDSLAPELSESIKRNMFVFEDIIILDDESIAAVLSEADERDIVVAMKPMPERERERLFARLPADRRERLKAEFEELGRIRLSECDAAGHRVVEIIRELEKGGLIGILRNPGPQP